MKVNESIYGAPETWDGNPTYNFLKMADFGENQNTLLNGVTLGKLSPDTPIDKSIAFCGVGKECPLSNVQILTNNGNDAIFESSIERTVTNWSLYTTTERWVIYGDPNRISDENSDWKDIVTDTNNINRYLKPIVDFNIKNLVGCILVRPYTAEGGGGFTVSLKEYLEQYINTHPYISEVYLYLYGGEVGSYFGRDPLYSGSGTYGGISVSTLDSFTIDSTEIYRYASYKGSSCFNYLPIYGSYDFDMFSGEKWLVYGDKDLFEINRDGDYLTCYIHVTNANEFKELCLKGAAQYGIYFTDDEDIARTGSFTDTNMYIGVLDENGITHGEYLKGSETADAIQNEWSSIRDSDYDYKKEIDPTNYVNDTRFYGQFYSNSFNKKWVINSNDVSNLSRELFSALNQVPEGESVQAYCQRVFLTNNPIDCIINLKKFPLSLIPAGAKQYNIKLGAYTSNVLGAPLLYSTDYLDFSFSNAQGNGLFPVNGDCFLDYEPYTKAELTVPFCGTCEIPCTYLYQYGINIRLIIDFTSGACTAYIMSRGITIDTLQGNCAIDLPVTGVQSATLDSQIFANAQADNRRMNALGVSLIGGAVAMAAAIFTGGATAALLGVAGAATGIIGSSISAAQQNAQIEYNFEHMQLPLKQVSSASPALAQSYDMRCKLRITRPMLYEGYNQARYANTIGHATCRNTTVASCTGFTVGVINVNGIAATAEEKEAIKNQFASGVYL